MRLDEEPTEEEILDRWFDAGVVVLCVLLLVITSQLTGWVPGPAQAVWH